MMPHLLFKMQKVLKKVILQHIFSLPISLTGSDMHSIQMVLWTRMGTYLENISTMADDLFLLVRESSLAVTLNDREVHCRLLNGVDSILFYRYGNTSAIKKSRLLRHKGEFSRIQRLAVMWGK